MWRLEPGGLNSNVRDYWNRRGVRRGCCRLFNGARQYDGADAAGELIIILGAAIGTVLVANPLHILMAIGKGIGGAFGGSPFTKQRYLESLKMMFELFNRARKEGLMSLETDSDAPNESAIFKKYPAFLKDHHALAFVCDSLRMAASGGIEPFDADQMMEIDMDVHHHGASLPVAALSTMADSLPGLGIVAAVLGVVITMGALGGPPEEIGHKVAAALVGTFLGILLCYGLIGPIAANMGTKDTIRNKFETPSAFSRILVPERG